MVTLLKSLMNSEREFKREARSFIFVVPGSKFCMFVNFRLRQPQVLRG